MASAQFCYCFPAVMVTLPCKVPSLSTCTCPQLAFLLLQLQAEVGSLWQDLMMLTGEEMPEHLGLGMSLCYPWAEIDTESREMPS